MLQIKNTPFIKDIHYDSADKFLHDVSYNQELYKIFDNRWIFRGHSSDKYKLIPSSFRKTLPIDKETELVSEGILTQEQKEKLLTFDNIQIMEECYLLQEFYRFCDIKGLYVPHLSQQEIYTYPCCDPKTLLTDNVVWLPKKYWELASLAQHHGVPTRLLDWTHELNVALYFAASGVLEIKNEGNPDNLEIWALNTEIVIHFPKDLRMRIIHPTYYKNDNIVAQRGLFTFWESFKTPFWKNNHKIDLGFKRDDRPLDQQLCEFLKEKNCVDHVYMYHITIPQSESRKIYKYCAHNGFDASTLFPGYDGVVRMMRENNIVYNL